MQTAAAELVSCVVALFGMTSAVLGFIAEANRPTSDEIHVSGHDCVYPANLAHKLGICTILLLVVAQIIASAAAGCCTGCRAPGGASSSYSTGRRRRRVVGLVAFVLSWVVAVIAVVYYWAGAALTRRAKSTGPFAEQECYLRRHNDFVRAAVLSLVATALGVTSCVLLSLPAAAKDAPPEQVVGLGPPQWPADPKLAPPQGQEHAQVNV